MYPQNIGLRPITAQHAPKTPKPTHGWSLCEFLHLFAFLVGRILMNHPCYQRNPWLWASAYARG